MSPAPGLLAGRTILVTGVLRPTSIASSIAALAADQGARVILTGAPATMAITTATARRLGLDPAIALDAGDPASLGGLEAGLRALGVARLDGLVHAIAHAERDLLGDMLPSEPGAEGSDRLESLQRAFAVSTASLPGLVHAVRPLLARGSAVLALSFDSQRAHRGYGWMGPLKAALEACVRALAVELGGQGVRVNALSCGPLRTPAASAIPGFEDLLAGWQARAPLGWDGEDTAPVARSALALLSDWLPATTGQVIHADGGAGITGH
ncbi:SDR family oxidoreductase [Actinomyces slackii]|uniref:Enoyl-[acyl-carrier-protein] reductase [NADH] n=1 Tax=Actinomyces slackii TaxID=52774 RepID=A0A3S4WKR2_9ACTO|nr:SDR family oxidoreductase [Actinomyces slackii]VEG75025.1 Enoyl-[acyl-carrier-protein] reductase [NADH] [Actinomyces slackii]